MAERSITGVVAAFVAGYVVGARAGRAGLDEVRDGLATIRGAGETGAALSALRSHAAGALRELAEWAAGTGPAPFNVGPLADRLRRLAAEVPRWPAS